MLTSGFIVLEHDLYQQTVDLAVGYFLPQAINSGNYTLKSIIGCLGLPCRFALYSSFCRDLSRLPLLRQAAMGLMQIRRADIGRLGHWAVGMK